MFPRDQLNRVIIPDTSCAAALKASYTHIHPYTHYTHTHSRRHYSGSTSNRITRASTRTRQAADDSFTFSFFKSPFIFSLLSLSFHLFLLSPLLLLSLLAPSLLSILAALMTGWIFIKLTSSRWPVARPWKPPRPMKSHCNCPVLLDFSLKRDPVELHYANRNLPKSARPGRRGLRPGETFKSRAGKTRGKICSIARSVWSTR